MITSSTINHAIQKLNNSGEVSLGDADIKQASPVLDFFQSLNPEQLSKLVNLACQDDELVPSVIFYGEAVLDVLAN